MNKATLREKIEIKDVNLLGRTAPENFISNSENAYKKQVAFIAKDIIERQTVKIVLLAGPSSAGKTTSANLIKKELILNGKEAEVISMDNFFINRDVTPMFEDGTYDFENVNTVDIPYFKNFINDILSDKVAKMPDFDFYTGTRKKEFTDIKLNKNSILIIEGIHALNPIIMDQKHEDQIYKVFVNPNVEYYEGDEKIVHVRELRRIRRMIRDFYTRGIKPHETLLNWKNVVAGEKKYIFPYKENADFILDSSHPYEPMMYRKYLPALLDGSKEAMEISEDLHHFEPMDVSLLPDDSLLQEFLSGVIKSLKNQH